MMDTDPSKATPEENMNTGFVEVVDDVEFESEILNVASKVEMIRARPLSVPAYKSACVSIRAAKVLLRDLDRVIGKIRRDSIRRLTSLAGQAANLAEQQLPHIPARSRHEFLLVVHGLQRHAKELVEFLNS
jgi:hypothetical protein